jgi:hypothetical protein
MKVYEAIQLCKPFIDSLKNYNIKVDYIKHMDLYNDFTRLKDEGHKITYISSYLAGVYNVSERTVYAIVKKMEEEV